MRFLITYFFKVKGIDRFVLSCYLGLSNEIFLDSYIFLNKKRLFYFRLKNTPLIKLNFFYFRLFLYSKNLFYFINNKDNFFFNLNFFFWEGLNSQFSFFY